MNDHSNFIDELLAEAEEKEQAQTRAHFDLLLLEIAKLQEEISNNFSESEKEIEIIKWWALERNSKLQNRTQYYERRLEAFIREEGEKTIDLPHGVLKLHKKPDKVEVVDVPAFLKHAHIDLMRIVPEQIKPDLNKIKLYHKNSGRLPAGVDLIEGKDEFTYKLINNGKDNNND